MQTQFVKLLNPFTGSLFCTNYSTTSGMLLGRYLHTQPFTHDLVSCSVTMGYHRWLGISSQILSSHSHRNLYFRSYSSAFRQKRELHRSFKAYSQINISNGRFASDSQNHLTWKFKLRNSFGTVSVKLNKSIKIDRIDVLRYPAGDHAAVHLVGKDSGSRKNVEELIGLDYDEGRETLTLVDDGRLYSDDERWVLEIPPYYDFEISHTGNQNDIIEVGNLENQRLAVKAVGDIQVHNIKSKDVTLESKSGAIKSTSVLQGNVVVKTKGDKGFIADRLQGHSFDVQTQDGSIHCRDAYGNVSSFKSGNGRVLLGNVTGECSVKTRGDVIVESLDGAIDADISGSGSFTGYLTRPNNVSVKTEEGDISMSVPSDVDCHLDLSAPHITLPTELGIALSGESDIKQAQGPLNSGGPSVSAATTEGSITLSLQSWFDSLKLGR